jgi:gamma-glutamyltranspeptidase / glutathione hydrolase
MVVSSHRLASEAGIAMLQQGGNAIDAAVAVGYVEAVVDPCCGNIGGGGFLVAHLAGHRDVFLNFRETAPGAATHDMYLDAEGNVARQASLFGWRAVAVPGTVMGLDAALTQYGTLPRSVVMAAAIRLAREGFDLTEFDTGILRRGTALFRRDSIAAGIFLHSDGSPLQVGERLVQPQLAATLTAIAAEGPHAFYQGRIPEAIEMASHAGGGIITAADIAAYHITRSEPLSCTYRGYVFLSAPPPSSGGATLCEILHVLDLSSQTGPSCDGHFCADQPPTAKHLRGSTLALLSLLKLSHNVAERHTAGGRGQACRAAAGTGAKQDYRALIRPCEPRSSCVRRCVQRRQSPVMSGVAFRNMSC